MVHTQHTHTHILPLPLPKKGEKIPQIKEMN